MNRRRKCLRKLLEPPKIKGFSPFGGEINENAELINLLFEEYEALKLCDYDLLTHFQASVEMNVSRPTFTRIYSSTRKKLAKAFVEGRRLNIEGGKVYFDTIWYQCGTCHSQFNNPKMEIPISNCPLCNSQQFVIVGVDAKPDDVKSDTAGICMCPKCGFEQPHEIGSPCMERNCPKCNALMRRKPREN